MISLTQVDIESQISASVPDRGARKDVARLTGIYESVLYAYFNADDPRKSPQFETLAIQAALDHLGIGDEHWNTMCRLRDISRPQSVRKVCLETEAAETVKECTDVFLAHIEGKPYFTQLSEIDQAIAQLLEHRVGVIDAINTEKSSTNGNNHRYGEPEIRKQMREAVKRAK